MSLEKSKVKFRIKLKMFFIVLMHYGPHLSFVGFLGAIVMSSLFIFAIIGVMPDLLKLDFFTTEAIRDWVVFLFVICVILMILALAAGKILYKKVDIVDNTGGHFWRLLFLLNLIGVFSIVLLLGYITSLF